jgi:hypothetical protein
LGPPQPWQWLVPSQIAPLSQRWPVQQACPGAPHCSQVVAAPQARPTPQGEGAEAPQQAWCSPPQGVQVPPAPQARPLAQSFPGQQLAPTALPQAWHIPARQLAPDAQVVPLQQGWFGPPQSPQVWPLLQDKLPLQAVPTVQQG